MAQQTDASYHSRNVIRTQETIVNDRVQTILREIYDYPDSGNAAVHVHYHPCSEYQAVFLPSALLEKKRPGDEASS